MITKWSEIFSALVRRKAAISYTQISFSSYIQYDTLFLFTNCYCSFGMWNLNRVLFLSLFWQG